MPKRNIFIYSFPALKTGKPLFQKRLMMQNARRAMVFTFFAVLFIILLPLCHASLMDFFLKVANPQQNMVGKAYVDFLKCRRYETLAEGTQTDVESLCENRNRQDMMECSRQKELLGKYLGYLGTFCQSEGCSDGDRQCRVSLSGRTQWLQICRNGVWANERYCYAGCNQDDCAPEELQLVIHANPTNMTLGDASAIVVEVRRMSGLPVSGARVRLGASSGSFSVPEGVTDGNGLFRTPWVGSRPGYNIITAASTVEDVYVRNFVYLLVQA